MTKITLGIILAVLLVGVGLVYAGQDPPTVYITQNQLMSSDDFLWYDVNSTETDGFVGYFTLALNGENWELAQLTPHGNTNHFIDNINYITSYAENIITALNGDNKVYLPIVTR